MDLPTALFVLGAGLAAGILSGMFGVGGAVITTPSIRAVGTTPILAVGSTIPAILPGALSGAYRYAKVGLVDWRVGLTCGLAGAVLAVAGSWVSDLVDARWLMVLTAVLLAWSGISIIRRERRRAGEGGHDRGPDDAAPVAGSASGAPATSASLAVTGAGAGFLAGLLGVGGGIVMMPVFTSVLRLPVKVAVASSLVAVAIFSVPALVTHTLLGHIDWAVALLLLVGTVTGAQVGARLTIRTGEQTVATLLGVFFVGVALVYGGGELVGILGA